MKRVISFLLLIFLLCSYPALAHTGTKALYREGKIVGIEDKSNVIQDIAGFTTQRITVAVMRDGKKEIITIEESRLPKTLAAQLKHGDTVYLGFAKDKNGAPITYITDYKRINTLGILGIIFFGIVIGVARWQGFSSFIGMVISFFAIIKIVIPLILKGVDPIISALLGGLIIIPVTFFLSHGINRKTVIAIFGTVIALAITGVLSILFVNMTRLTGFASEDAGFVQLLTQGTIDIRNLFLGGIMIGAMGILDDITISQTSIVDRLKKANPSYSMKKLYSESMIVGRDHIASLVNTLVLVYAGAALPLFVLFVNQNLSLLPVLNHELVATEIVRTVVSSIGIVLAVPITTVLACMNKKISN